MKKVLFLVLTITFAILSCKKDHPQPINNEGVNISGKSYSTITIGNQIWTSENYDGEGGSSTNTVESQKAYSLAEAKSITLPEGWRLPTKADFEKLVRYLGEEEDWYTSNQGQNSASYFDLSISSETAAKLMEKKKWYGANVNNSSGFSARPLEEDNDVPTEMIANVLYWGADDAVCFMDLSTLKNDPNDLGGAIIHDVTRSQEYENYKGAIRFLRDK